MSQPTKKRDFEPEGHLDSRPAKRVKADNSARVGPVARLNFDVLQIIASYLTPREIVSLERVSKEWQTRTRDWLTRAAYRLTAETTHPAIQLGGLLHPEQKHYFRLLHNLRSGNAVSAHILDCRDERGRVEVICWRRDLKFAAWVVSGSSFAPTSPQTRNPSSDILYWRQVSANEETISYIPATRFLPLTSGTPEAAYIYHLAVNDDGTMLVQLTLDRDPEVLERNLVYSPDENKVLWSEFTTPSARKGKGKGKGSDKNIIMPRVPYLLGQSTVYTAPWERPFRWIVAINFRTRAQLWKMKLHIATSNSKKAPTRHMRIIQAANGAELLLHSRVSEKKQLEGVSIINGKTGIRLGHVEYPNPSSTSTLHLDSILAHPASRQMAIIDIISEYGNAKLSAHQFISWTRVVLLSHYAYNPNTGYSLLHTDALLAGHAHNPLQVPKRPRPSQVIVNPFYRTAIVSSLEQRDPNERAEMCFYSCVMEPTENAKLRACAEAVLAERFKKASAVPTLRQCFVLGEVETVTVPSMSRDAQGGKAREDLRLPDFKVSDSGHFTDDGSVVVCTGHPQYFLRFG
ncbi:uncharacterized protein DSM5745_09845 [Aspergillus mulundensis]|uniref:F-box domain-containing protein n=1 Tax=Aspergillus mulundensis TaxID=1810919 RepID=A0A3D8QSG5_9EURO|nr:hypothetical protein DSM5745_09845 [Aspergillus mulundensis]RDW64434.1 hypothetical protein DSM5745_09845 [Aspergillus mulundensis]